MHDTALELGRKFFAVYAPPVASILDIGAMDVNGSLRSCAPADAQYIGVDLASGNGVDVVLEDPQVLPFDDGKFDLIVSSSCFEHDPMFWLTFLEVVRVTKPGGYIYINAPSNGWYHTHPMDNWRFYPDAGLALQTWARRQGYYITLMESFTASRGSTPWNDFVMIFARGTGRPVQTRIADELPNAINVRVVEDIDTVRNQSIVTEDMQILQRLSEEIRTRDARIAELEALLSARNDASAVAAG